MKKNIIIFGSGGLIGKHLTYHLKQKFNVLEFDLNKKNKNVFKLDVKKAEDLKIAIAKIEKKFKNKIYGVINCVYPKRLAPIAKKGSLSINYKNFSKDLNNHIECFYNINQVMINYFLKKKINGKIINFSSIYGTFLPRFEIYKKTKMSMPLQYAIAKQSIILMTKFLAKENKQFKLNINCISPGGIFDCQDKNFVKKYSSYCMNKSMLIPSDILSTVDFLLNEGSQKITGQNIIIDDGFTL